MTNSINVHSYAARHASPVCTVDFGACKCREAAQPTSRLLNGTADHWAAEEWGEDISLPDGRNATCYYLFAADEIVDDDGESLEAEQYPWDAEHVSWIELAPVR